MNSLQMSTDKLLLTVFVTVLVGFLTAAMSIVRLVNDKESKTTDYRQSWNDSLRKCFAALISNINILAGLTTSRMSSADGINELMDHELESEDPKMLAIAEKVRAYLDKKILDEDAHMREIRRAMHESYALTRLHFKPNDLSFARVEQKFDLVLELFSQMNALSSKEGEGERKVLREKIHAASAEITAFSRDILKTEWEAVKRGEIAYQRTKFWSVVGGAVALAGLIVFGLTTAWTFLRAEAPAVSVSPAALLPSLPSEVDRTTASNLVPPSQNSQTLNVYNSPAACSTIPRQPGPQKPSAPVLCPTREK